MGLKATVFHGVVCQELLAEETEQDGHTYHEQELENARRPAGQDSTRYDKGKTVK